MSIPHIRRFALAALGACFAHLALAQGDSEDEFDREPEDCIIPSRIDRTEVLDDRNIIFHMRGRAIYRNYLPRNCPGLEREGRFMYEIRGSQLCQIDSITVLEQFGGTFNRGFTCPLGMFYPMTPEEVEELKLLAEGGADAIEIEPADVPEDAGDAEDADNAGETDGSDAEE